MVLLLTSSTLMRHIARTTRRNMSTARGTVLVDVNYVMSVIDHDQFPRFPNVSRPRIQPTAFMTMYDAARWHQCVLVCNRTGGGTAANDRVAEFMKDADAIAATDSRFSTRYLDSDLDSSTLLDIWNELPQPQSEADTYQLAIYGGTREISGAMHRIRQHHQSWQIWLSPFAQRVWSDYMVHPSSWTYSHRIVTCNHMIHHACHDAHGDVTRQRDLDLEARCVSFLLNRPGATAPVQSLYLYLRSEQRVFHHFMRIDSSIGFIPWLLRRSPAFALDNIDSTPYLRYVFRSEEGVILAPLVDEAITKCVAFVRQELEQRPDHHASIRELAQQLQEYQRNDKRLLDVVTSLQHVVASTPETLEVLDTFSSDPQVRLLTGASDSHPRKFGDVPSAVVRDRILSLLPKYILNP